MGIERNTVHHSVFRDKNQSFDTFRRDLTEAGSSGGSNNFETKPSKPGELKNLMSLNFETAPGGYGGGSRNPYDQQGRGFDPKWDGGTNFKRRLYKGIGV